MKRRICVITGSRAEYGLLRPLIKEINSDPALKLQLIATGSHLSKYFGMTYKEIENNGFNMDEKIDMALKSDTTAGILKSMGFAMLGFAKAYAKLKPDIIVVLGDRFEIFSAVVSALFNKVPVAHIAGGEITEGVFDEYLRHAITKMGHLHFTIAEDYRRRVIQLGEDPKRVFNVGALGVNNIKNLKLLSKEALEKELKLKFNKRNLLVTFHPVTLEDAAISQFKNLVSVLAAQRDTGIIFTKANADTGGREINRMIDVYVSKNRGSSRMFSSLGHLRYLSLMQFVDAVVGNSSSGIVEAPSFKIGTINIGDRQKGRIKAKSIIDCKPIIESITRAFKKVYSEKFQKSLKSVVNPYGDGKAAERIKKILKHYDISNIIKKEFYDL